MTPKEFISYVDELPAECIEERTAEKIVFHLPRSFPSCPKCGAQGAVCDGYYNQKLRGVTTKPQYIYRKRRYRCKCGKTFSEDNPFIGKRHTIVSSRLKVLRGNKGLTTREMAHLVGTTQSVYRWLEGEESIHFINVPISIEIAERAVKVVDSTIEECFGSRERLEKMLAYANATHRTSTMDAVLENSFAGLE